MLADECNILSVLDIFVKEVCGCGSERLGDLASRYWNVGERRNKCSSNWTYRMSSRRDAILRTSLRSGGKRVTPHPEIEHYTRRLAATVI